MIDFILDHVLLEIVLCYYKIKETNLLNKIQFNSLYINMWFSSLNIFEENEFYGIKKQNK